MGLLDIVGLCVCVCVRACVLPPDSGPAIFSPTSPAEEAWTCPVQGGQGASHSAWLLAGSNLHTHTHKDAHTQSEETQQIYNSKDSHQLIHTSHCCHIKTHFLLIVFIGYKKVLGQIKQYGDDAACIKADQMNISDFVYKQKCCLNVVARGKTHQKYLGLNQRTRNVEIGLVSSYMVQRLWSVR